jgi:uncharacterized protein (DUF488 family)
MYDEEGRVLYGEVARSPRFRRGLDRLTEGAARFRVAMLCSEENPTHCHRRLLITRVLNSEGVIVTHIRADGTQIDEGDLVDELERSEQPSLFDIQEGKPWTSTLPVSQSTPQRSSSSP